jgi:hypothetical protein
MRRGMSFQVANPHSFECCMFVTPGSEWWENSRIAWAHNLEMISHLKRDAIIGVVISLQIGSPVPTRKIQFTA